MTALTEKSVDTAAVGITLMTIGVASLCVSDAMAKTLTQHYAPIQIMFLRNLIALPFAILIAWRMGGAGALRSRTPMAHLLRGILWIGATVLFFTSIRYLGLAEATALIFVAPLFITAISAVFLKEQVGWRRWSAVLVGFAGVLVIVRPGTAAFELVMLLPVATAFVYALLMLSARFVDSAESVWTLLLYLTGAGVVLSAGIVPFFWQAVRAEDLWLFAGIALFGTAGMTLMTQAFRLAPAAVVAPLDYTALVWATGLGWLFWNEVPDRVTFVGAGIIILSGVFTILRERKSDSD
ncbi:DMT family transporter [Donghicola eburneus]|uniref:Putative membrane protein n=1 Tax=Donghicola eburneus TaxID=393278 RepID=A0A1M4MZT0_9RHOB|nr:DMT family transporter [Donghicola eburneus]SCM67307.1 putative membrane protein [Donghicola eburneus]SFQ01669.1 EamA domain-containing membrane protein RarD [Donghicola eburneus]